MEKKQAARILNRLKQEYPQAGTRLVFQDPFQLVMAVVLSAQSTDEQVNRVTKTLFDRCRTPADFAAIPLADLEELIHGVGIYRNKARHLKALGAVLVEQYHGKVPDDFESLMRLPGVGRKSANVILAVGFHKPGLGVDTHVQRVANRLGMASSKNPHHTEAQLKALIKPERWNETHHLLISHGRAACKARKPRCGECPIETLCEKNLED